MNNPKDLIDLVRYPINASNHPDYERLIASIRGDLEQDGCAVLKQFVKPEAVSYLLDDAHSAAPFAHSSKNRTNAYFGQDDDSLPDTHPMRRFFDRSNSFIPADNFFPETSLRSLYE